MASGLSEELRQIQPRGPVLSADHQQPGPPPYRAEKRRFRPRAVVLMDRFKATHRPLPKRSPTKWGGR